MGKGKNKKKTPLCDKISFVKNKFLAKEGVFYVYEYTTIYRE